MEQQQLSDWKKQQGKNAHHRALIMQILKRHPRGLTTQQIVGLEQEYYGYTFLTDNRLRELRAQEWVISEGRPQRWIPTLKEA